MRRFRPIHGILLVSVLAAIPFASYLLGGVGGSAFTRVAPDPSGTVQIGIDDLEAGQVRFYRFLNSGNQEVKFFVGRDKHGEVHVAFDANDICFKRKRGYDHDGDWLVCGVCDKAFKLEEVNAGGGGCKPVPLEHRVEGAQLVLAEANILQGWRYFR